MKKIFIVTFILFPFLAKSQVTSTPHFPVQDAKLTVYFDAKNTPLESYNGDIYTHTGVSINNDRWQHVIGTWGGAEQPKLERVSADYYKLEIGPSINEFYNISPGEKVTELCFVFRSEDSQKQSKDIFLKVYESGLAVNISSPSKQPYFVDANSSFNINVDAIFSDSTLVKIDGELKHTEINSPNSIDFNINVPASGTHNIIVEAYNSTNKVSDSFSFNVRGSFEVKSLPANVKDGINYIDDNTVCLVLHAPYKESVYVIGSFNDWQHLSMYKTSGDINDKELRYWVIISNLAKGKEYFFQYFIDESLIIPDPYSDKISDPWSDKDISEEIYPNLIKYPEGKTEGIVSVFQTLQSKYDWQISDFKSPKQTDLVIYELLVRDFAENASYQTLIDTVQYFKQLGVNAIELMPINEFEGNNSWGYNPSFYFAPDKAYGTKNKLKEFIDVCHQNGIAIIIDMVLNHSFGQSPFVRMYFDKDNNQPSEQNLWYNQVSPNTEYSWGYDFNHESKYTQALVDSINTYWTKEYKVDGFRFDFTKGFTNKSGNGWTYDDSRINILKRMYDKIIAINSDAYVICEHLTDNSEEKVLANYGIMLWGNMNGKYAEAAMGYNDGDKSDLAWGYYKNRGWDNAKLVSYMESHDEERLMFKTLNYGRATLYYNTKDTANALKRMELAAAFFFTIPGPKMLWQFGELGYDISIDEPERVAPKPIKWDYYDDARRFRLYQVYAALIKLKVENDVFKNGELKLSVTEKAKRINLSGSDMDVTVIGNFDVNNTGIDTHFQKTGEWYDYFSGELRKVDNVNENITLAPGEFHIYTSKKLDKPDLIDLNTGVYETEKESVDLKTIVFPNPTSSILNFEFELPRSTENCKIYIINIKGEKIEQLYFGKMCKGKHKFVVNLEGKNLCKGMYLIQIKGNELNSNKIFIVK